MTNRIRRRVQRRVEKGRRRLARRSRPLPPPTTTLVDEYRLLADGIQYAGYPAIARILRIRADVLEREVK